MLSESSVINYKECALSAYRSKLSYLSPDELLNTWRTASNETQIVNAVFNDVLEEPVHYSNSDTGAFAYSWIQDTHLHFVFRGTSDLDDIKIDIQQKQDFLLPGNKKISVHSGFLQQFRSISDKLLKTITDYKGPLSAVEFSGHSLGGGLATIASGFFSPVIRELHKCRILCITIGSPRVGNVHFAEWWAKLVDESYRIVNSMDPIPLVPVNGYYNHICGGLRLDADGTATRIQRDSPWYRRIFQIPNSINCCNPIKNHFTDVYIARLLRLSHTLVPVLV
jgi:hypothetical protein